MTRGEGRGHSSSVIVVPVAGSWSFGSGLLVIRGKVINSVIVSIKRPRNAIRVVLGGSRHGPNLDVMLLRGYGGGGA